MFGDELLSPYQQYTCILAYNVMKYHICDVPSIVSVFKKDTNIDSVCVCQEIKVIFPMFTNQVFGGVFFSLTHVW